MRKKTSKMLREKIQGTFVNVRFSTTMANKLAEIASNRGTTVSQILRDIVYYYVIVVLGKREDLRNDGIVQLMVDIDAGKKKLPTVK